MTQPDFKLDFIGIGTPRAASTYIWQCLRVHPQICTNSGKEPHFFDKFYQKGFKYYQSFFNRRSKNKIVGEITPSYLYNKKTPFLIKKHFPNIKLIVSLRNPMIRAYSEYWFVKKKFGKYKSFRKALQALPRLIESGFYYRYLKNYFNIFPKRNILVLIYEDLEKEPVEFIQNIYRFLGVRFDFLPPLIYQRENQAPEFYSQSLYRLEDFLGKKMREHRKLHIIFQKFKIDRLIKFIHELNYQKVAVRPEMNYYLRRKLQNIYYEDIRRLEKLINRDLSFWE